MTDGPSWARASEEQIATFFATRELKLVEEDSESSRSYLVHRSTADDSSRWLFEKKTAIGLRTNLSLPRFGGPTDRQLVTSAVLCDTHSEVLVLTTDARVSQNDLSSCLHVYVQVESRVKKERLQEVKVEPIGGRIVGAVHCPSHTR